MSWGPQKKRHSLEFNKRDLLPTGAGAKHTALQEEKTNSVTQNKVTTIVKKRLQKKIQGKTGTPKIKYNYVFALQLKIAEVKLAVYWVLKW